MLLDLCSFPRLYHTLPFSPLLPKFRIFHDPSQAIQVTKQIALPPAKTVTFLTVRWNGSILIIVVLLVWSKEKCFSLFNNQVAFYLTSGYSSCRRVAILSKAGDKIFHVFLWHSWNVLSIPHNFCNSFLLKTTAGPSNSTVEQCKETYSTLCLLISRCMKHSFLLTLKTENSLKRENPTEKCKLPTVCVMEADLQRSAHW